VAVDRSGTGIPTRVSAAPSFGATDEAVFAATAVASGAGAC
jgi:hypothetical protein